MFRQEDLSSEPVLKTWALDRLEKTGLPKCLSALKIHNNMKQFPVSSPFFDFLSFFVLFYFSFVPSTLFCRLMWWILIYHIPWAQISAFAALPDLTQLAIGFANGAISLVRGDLINDLGTKQRIVHESEEPITGVELRSEDKVTTLFVSTTSRILRLGISAKGNPHHLRAVEDSGCAVGCMTVDERTGNIIVGREDAIYYYTLDGRGPPRAYEAQKSLISVYQDYIAIISPPEAGTGVKEATTMRRRFGGAAAEALFNTSTLTILETDLRLVAHSEPLVSPVKALVQIWGDLFAILQNGKVHRYHEKALQQRLELLYQRNLFPLAIELAKHAGMDLAHQQIIFRKFGDSLYQKTDYDGAMAQYIKAIDTTEPSEVIRKFLDTQRIHNLIEYLEELHEHHKATADHTTLLLNCYAKLKDTDKLEKFIKSPGDLKFDLETAILMCRQGGYYEQAAYLAKKHGEEDLVVDILVEDCKTYDEALAYIWQLEAEVAYPCFMKYARVLIENCPKDATQFFIDYYTGKYQPQPFNAATVATKSENGTPLSGRGIAVSAVQNLTNLLPLPYMNTSAVGTPTSQPHLATVSDRLVKASVSQYPHKYTLPKPRTAFSSFIDHLDEFIVFLEALLSSSRDMTETDRTDLNTTLFEIYLLKASEKKGSARESWEAKAKNLISSPTVENSDVLLLSHLSSFQAGTTIVKEQAGLLTDIFRSYTSAKDTRGALNALHKYGPREPALYVLALSYLVSDARVLEEAGPDELGEVLKKIDADGLMAPLQVVQALSSSSSSSTTPVATMGLVKPYLSRAIERERQEIAANRRRIRDFRTETAQRRDELQILGEKHVVFQTTRCADCGAVLELPVVHFLCKHSFHQRCLPGGGEDTSEECPACKGQNAAIRAMKNQQGENRERHDLFQAEVERSDDRFGSIVGWFGRGVMGGN